MQQISMEPNLDGDDLFYVWPLIEPVGKRVSVSSDGRLTLVPRDFSGGPRSGYFNCEVRTSGLVDGHQAPLIPASRDVSPIALSANARRPLAAAPADGPCRAMAAGKRPAHGQALRNRPLVRAAALQFRAVPVHAARTGARHVDRCHRRFRIEPSSRTLRVLCHGPGHDAPQPGNTVAGGVGLSLRRVARGPAMLPGPPVARARLGRGLPRRTIRSRRRSCGGARRSTGCTAAGCDWMRRRRPSWAPRPHNARCGAPGWAAGTACNAIGTSTSSTWIASSNANRSTSRFPGQCKTSPTSCSIRAGGVELAAALWASLAAMLRSGIMGWLTGVVLLIAMVVLPATAGWWLGAQPGKALATVRRAERPAAGRGAEFDRVLPPFRADCRPLRLAARRRADALRVRPCCRSSAGRRQWAARALHAGHAGGRGLLSRPLRPPHAGRRGRADRRAGIGGIDGGQPSPPK